MVTEFEITLSRANNEEYEQRILNERNEDGNVVPHRVDTIGTDWNAKYMTVKGRMPVVVHGFESQGSDVGYSLAVFEWQIVRNSNKRRFRKVTLEVVFEADGPRGKAEGDAERMRSKGTASRTYWDPEVMAFAPDGTAWYQRSQREVVNKTAWTVDLKAGYAPFLSAGPQYAWSKSESHTCTEGIQVSGERAFVGGEGSRTRANAVRWTLLENPNQVTGVSALIRTAVLLKRRPKDDGRFIGIVKADYEISKYQDARRSALLALGKLPKNEPIVFDPNVATEKSVWHANSNALAAIVPDLKKEFSLVSLELIGDESSGSRDEEPDEEGEVEDGLVDDDDDGNETE
ncbi:hypothetical protein F4810DRAFT_687345 [Camillea tinctor]|nr:hypothetical protein F4810DRAFT_687345 [Camillea tinctor]